MHLPSPLHDITFRNFSISIKRDDLIDPFISGNKWRKLKYTLVDAQQLNKNHLVTFGGAYSNHLLATAVAAARYGFKASAFVRGEKVNNPMLTLCQLYGMNLYFTDRESYRNKPLLFEQHFSVDEKAYFVNEGGAGENGVKGCAEIINELQAEYDYIFCAAGTGTTAAGLLKGINQYQLKTELHIIPVLKGANFIKDEILNYEKNYTPLHLHLDYHFGGYGKTQSILYDFIKEFVASTGILIDPIYTGKMFFAIFDLLRQGKIDNQAKILAIHTGGIHGILGKIEEFHF